MSRQEEKILLGIIGTGRIAQRFLQMVKETNLATVSCIYNPNLDSARTFAEKNGISKYTNDWEQFLSGIQAAYVASPHKTHATYTRKLLQSSKHVLCEKPMCFHKKEAQELYQLADAQKCLLREAMKTAYCPGFLAMMEMAKSGKIGTIRDVEACFSRLTPTNVREYTDWECGGSFTEFGSYVLLPVLKLLGTEWKDISYESVYAPNGVDSYTNMHFSYANAMATVKTGLGVKTEGQLVISGTKGYLLCPSPWWLTKKFEIRYEDANKIEQYEFPYESSGLQYELKKFIKEIEDGASDAKEGLTAEESIASATVMEYFLSQTKQRREKSASDKKVNIWAHRGCSMQYPENTLEAFEAAAKLSGITGIELDVQFTKDNEVVVFHDENVSRVTNGTKNICEYTLEELKRLEIRSVNGTIARIPTLEEVLKLLKPYCVSKGLLINIELKTSVIRYLGIEAATLELVQKHGLESYIVYSSFLPESVAVVKQLNPIAQTGMLAGSLEDAILYARDTHADALHPGNFGLSGCVPEDMKEIPVRVWNVEEPFFEDGRVLKEKNMVKYEMFGATDIITNVPERYL